jgi:anti-sigma-K factor RskA
MFEEDQETLAAEYVLGTLSGEEREHAEALRSFDPEFDAAVKQWERRLGELNVMVEDVEPPPVVWEKIKSDIGIETPPEIEPEAVAETEGVHDLEPAESPETAPDLMFPETEGLHEEAGHEEAAAEEHGEAPVHDFGAPHDFGRDLANDPGARLGTQFPPTLTARREDVEHDADVVALRKRVGRWRGFTIGLGAIAAVLAAYIAVSRLAPGLIPAKLRGTGGDLIAQTQPPEHGPVDRLVAVLQQQPMAPAFLLTVDTQQRTVVVRRVSAGLETGRSYELWLMNGRSSPPRSLGVVGNDEFTQRPLPANVDLDTLRSASFAVSLEPAGGSPSGAPTGPVLFTGKAVESLPAAPPPAPKT